MFGQFGVVNDQKHQESAILQMILMEIAISRGS